jgi:hypothetical protein
METDVERWLTYRWQKGNRYYVAELMQDLFGAWLVRRTWGSIHSHRGHSITIRATDYEHALKLLREIEKRRTTRGYTLTD